MKYVFGPVPSRRLGQSLGIDTVPLKTCNWNCVYCQLGRSRPLVNERKEYVPRQEIVEQLRQGLSNLNPDEIDWVTFVASGETTLHAGMGWLVRQAKALARLPVAVITNGSLLHRPEVREELSAADAVLPSLDAGSAHLYRRINRPHRSVTFERLLEGLTAFRREYRGRMWLEVMLVRGLNDTEDALGDIARTVGRIRPDAVHLDLPARPPAEPWVEGLDQEGLMRATAILGDIAEVVHPVEGTFDLSGYDDVVDAVLAIITRHPMRQEELEQSLAQWAPGRVQQALVDLESGGRARTVERHGSLFWCAAASRYPGVSARRRSGSSDSDEPQLGGSVNGA